MAEIIVHPATIEEAEAEAERREELPRLWKAIVDNTQSDASFWLGEILLSTITKETGYKGHD